MRQNNRDHRRCSAELVATSVLKGRSYRTDSDVKPSPIIAATSAHFGTGPVRVMTANSSCLSVVSVQDTPAPAFAGMVMVVGGRKYC